ncbi:MAG: alpha/beta hydrolase, partial [Myxococcota bacterium]
MPRPEPRPRTAAAAQAARREFDESPLFQFAKPSDHAEERSIPGPGGDLPLRIFRPKAGPVRGALLHIHGGGWVIGRPAMNDPVNERRADELGLVVVSVDYRLAPEHPYPAGPDDCEAAAVWLVENAASEFGADPSKILVGGESAGGHLSAVTALRMQRHHGFRFAGANLVYGVYDLSGVPSHTALDDRNVILNSANIDWFVDCFAPDPALRRDPDVSPLHADLSGAPPALFTVGTLDPLLDHSLFLYPRWLAAGNQAEIQVFPGCPHGFDAFPVPEGQQATAAIDAFLTRCIA